MIPIQNIYYMLSYSFQILREQGYRNMATEEFENTADLFAAILSKGITAQVKRGLGKSYIPKTENLSLLRGKIDITESVKTQALVRRQMVCTYDDFSVNTYMNQIIKSSMVLLLKSDIPPKRKKELRKLLVYFQNVDTLDLYNADWTMHYNRNNQTYQLLISICYLLVKGLLQTNTNGQAKLMDFMDEQRMCRLYEKFILEYYRKEFPILTVSASQIPWVIDDGMDAMLPVMQSDIMLSYKDTVLIIDAKYYTHTTQTQYDIHTLHSNNLYQIFTYVKNKEMGFPEREHKVSGMLLYARTDEDIQPNQTYQMSGNRIDVKTLDLNGDFSLVAKQLDNIIEDFFGIRRELVG